MSNPVFLVKLKKTRGKVPYTQRIHEDFKSLGELLSYYDAQDEFILIAAYKQVVGSVVSRELKVLK